MAAKAFLEFRFSSLAMLLKKRMKRSIDFVIIIFGA